MIDALKKLSNQAILNLAPYIPGRSIESVQREFKLTEIHKLGSNENPLGPSPKAILAMQSALKNMHSYPDPDSFELRHALAHKVGLDPDQIVLGNGSDNLLDLMGLIFAGPAIDVLLSQYAFANFMITARIHHANPVVVQAKNWGHDLDGILAAMTPKTRLLFLANPNNPTGTYFTDEKFKQFMQAVPTDVIVVLDEAYYEYAQHLPDYPKAISLLPSYPNLFITRTFSKAYGLAGVRVGYGMTHPEIANIINRVRLPFNLSTIAQAAALAALDDLDHVNTSVALARESIASYESTWRALGLDYIPSSANFSTLDLGRNSSNIYQKLLGSGIIVRPLHPYGMPNHLRISTGLYDQNQKAMKAIATLIHK